MTKETTFPITKEMFHRFVARAYYEGCIDGSIETYFNNRDGTTGALEKAKQYADKVIEQLEELG